MGFKFQKNILKQRNTFKFWNYAKIFSQIIQENVNIYTVPRL